MISETNPGFVGIDSIDGEGAIDLIDGKEQN
jgi:hypothetical protein